MGLIPSRRPRRFAYGQTGTGKTYTIEGALPSGDGPMPTGAGVPLGSSMPGSQEGPDGHSGVSVMRNPKESQCGVQR